MVRSAFNISSSPPHVLSVAIMKRHFPSLSSAHVAVHLGPGVAVDDLGTPVLFPLAFEDDPADFIAQEWNK